MSDIVLLVSRRLCQGCWIDLQHDIWVHVGSWDKTETRSKGGEGQAGNIKCNRYPASSGWIY